MPRFPQKDMWAVLIGGGMRVQIDGSTSVGRNGESVRLTSEFADWLTQDEAARLTSEFADWLTQDEEVGPHAKMHRTRAARADGGMSGELVEWINLAVSSSFSVVALVYAHRSFRASLLPRLRSSVRLVIEDGDVRVVVEEGSEEDAARVALAFATLQAASGAAASPDDPSASQVSTSESGDRDSS